MVRLLKSILGFVIGTICGAVVGAAMLAIPTYLDNRCGFLGCSKDWTPIAIYFGVILGALPGAVIGFIVGVGCLNKPVGAAVGAVIGAIILVILFAMGAAGDALVTGWGLAAIPAAALVGLIVAMLLGLMPISKDNI
jgi:hypothetical protein